MIWLNLQTVICAVDACAAKNCFTAQINIFETLIFITKHIMMHKTYSGNF